MGYCLNQDLTQPNVVATMCEAHQGPLNVADDNDHLLLTTKGSLTGVQGSLEIRYPGLHSKEFDAPMLNDNTTETSEMLLVL